MVHAIICEAKRQAETLHRFRIMPCERQFALWLSRGGGDWNRIGIFQNRDDAEDYLFSKLPCIESEL